MRFSRVYLNHCHPGDHWNQNTDNVCKLLEGADPQHVDDTFGCIAVYSLLKVVIQLHIQGVSKVRSDCKLYFA